MVRKSEKEDSIDQETAAEIALSKIIGELDSLLDIPLTLSAELGRTQMTVREIMQLQFGSVLELSKLVGEPMEIHINKLLTARGETVVVNERFGIRVTDVIDPLEIVRTSV